MNAITGPQLGDFIDPALWKDALRLLSFQIAERSRNRHFNTLSMYYYTRLGSATKACETDQYYCLRVANGLFYGLRNEFALLPYSIPKAGLGLRNYKFFTFPLRALYYAVGLYVLKLSQDLVSDYVAQHKHIRSYYGGGLSFQKDGLSITSNNIYYRSYYQAFRKRVRKETIGDVEHRIIIKLDIENYYDELPVLKLMELLHKWVKPSIQAELKFDGSVDEQVVSFFGFLSGGKPGIPQADNDIVSAFLGHLYLVFADMHIDDLIHQYGDSIIGQHAIVRYVDDIYLSVTFKSETDASTREMFAGVLASQIADDLFFRFGLRINSKSRLFWLNSKADRDELLKGLRKVSPKYHISDDENDESPDNKIANIFDELEDLKGSRIDASFTQARDLQAEILKEVFDPRVEQMLSMPGNRTRIARLFSDFNFELVKASPLEIIILIMKDKASADRFRQFLLAKPNLTTSDVDLIVRFLCQTGFNDAKLLDKLGENPMMKDILTTYRSASLSTDLAGYYSLPMSKVESLAGMPLVIQQIRLRVLSENTKSYSVALNHLLNEVHGIARERDPIAKTKGKKYDANDVVTFLVARHAPHGTVVGIRNLFDRRNTNQISHPGSEDSLTWGVTEKEYLEYRQCVGDCLAYIL